MISLEEFNKEVSDFQKYLLKTINNTKDKEVRNMLQTGFETCNLSRKAFSELDTSEYDNILLIMQVTQKFFDLAELAAQTHE